MTGVKCILGYYDTKLNRSVAIGEEFEVDDNRAGQLIKAKVVELLTTTTPEKVVKRAKAKKEA